MPSITSSRRPPSEAHGWIKAEKARRHLRDFVRQAWHVVEPATPFVPGWHLDAICDHLEAVTRGEIRNLLINMPPRHAKSLTVSVFWPVWEWVRWPERRWLFASYATSLSVRDSLKCRRIIESPWYQANWGDVYRLTSDQNAKTRFENDKTGYRIASSVGGANTGEGGQRLVCDDPHNVKESESAALRESTLLWWDEVMSTRLNDQKTGARVIVMQRVHERDLSGHVLEQGGYEHLCLPAEYEGDRRVTATGWSDPRTEPGELLWPERVGPDELAELKASMGPYAAAGQLQQRPSPRAGGMFRRDWWKRYATLPPLVRIEQFVDSAFKEGVQSDYSVCATWGTDGLGRYYVIDVYRQRLEYPRLMRALHDEHAEHAARAASVPLVIEDKGSGQSAIQTLRQPLPTLEGAILPALPVIGFPVPANQSKAGRAEAVTPTVQAGLVYLPESAPWVADFIEEHAAFPAGAHDDQVDTTAMALTRLAHDDMPFGWLRDDPAVAAELARLRAPVPDAERIAARAAALGIALP